jgi:peptide/nickel transport system substrate-binding protein
VAHESPKQGMGRREFLQKGLAAGTILLTPSLLAACGNSSSAGTSTTAAAGAVKRGGKLRVGFVGGGDLETLDPQSALNDVDFGRGLNLYDRITHFLPDMSVGNLLAESFEPNSAGTAWQLKLKSGVTFHNGKPLTANDVLYSYQRIVTKNLMGASRLTSVDWKHAKVTSNLTLLMPMLQQWIDLPAMFAEVYDSILPEGTTSFKHPIGTGPFKFVEWHQGQQSLFVKNPDYFISGLPYVDELEEVSIPDNTSRLEALQAGQIDAMASMDFAQAKSLANSPTIKLVVADTDYNVPIYMRTDRAPFTDNRVREAMRLLANRPQMVADCFFEFGTIANDLFGKGVPYYDNGIPQRVYDPEKAKALLKQAGHPDGLNLTLYTSTLIPGMLDSATVYAQQAKAGGVNIKLFQTPASTYFGPEYYLKVAFAQSNYQGTIPIMWASSFTSTAPFNETAWHRPAWDKGFNQAEATQDPAKRQQIFDDLQLELWNEGGYISWGDNYTLDATSPKVQGMVPNKWYLLGGCDFKSVWFS